MRKSNILATLALILTAAIWGLSYSAQAEAMKSMSPLFFVFVRYLIGCLVLLPVIFSVVNCLVFIILNNVIFRFMVAIV